MITTRPDQLVLEIDTAIYPLPAIHRALYWLAGDATGAIEPSSGTLVRISLDCAEGIDRDHLRKNLLQALGDFALRIDVEERTRSIRETILAAALCEAVGPLKPGGDA